MTQDPRPALNWRQALPAVFRAWKPLLAYELLMSLLTTTVLAPLFLSCAYELIGISDDAVWANWDLARFLGSLQGILALVLGSSVMLGLLLLRYAGLILLADAALRGGVFSIGQIVIKTLVAAPRMLGLAALATMLAVLTALPLLGLAALSYRLLLSGADINYYLTERPPRFWIAVCCVAVLVITAAAAAIGIFARWAFAVPACVLEQMRWRSALQSSSRLMRGRTVRVLLVLGCWQLVQALALGAALAGLDQLNDRFLTGAETGLWTLLWSTATLLLIDAVVLQLLIAVFEIGTAVFIARDYEQACRSVPGRESRIPEEPLLLTPPTRLARFGWAAVCALAVFGPTSTMIHGLRLSHEFVEHRPAQVTAHRAGPKSAPENSLAALRLALDAKADFVEIDVQQTADGEVVLLHDRDLRRVTGDPRELHQVNLAELRDLRLRITGGAATDERIPTLADFLAGCNKTIRLNVELKETSRNQQLAGAVVDLLREHQLANRAVVTCFDLPPLVEVRKLEPTLPVGMILTAVKGDLTRLPVNILSLNQRLISADVVRRAHERGLEVYAWTVNDRGSALRLLDLGCDNLITSDPVLMREVVDWYSSLGDTERMLLRLRRWLRE
jgi:glycerophosphoryl diester phosphodiesterase